MEQPSKRPAVLSITVSLGVIIAVFVAASNLSSKLNVLEERLSGHIAYSEKLLTELKAFQDKGDRFTATDGQVLSSRIMKLESTCSDANWIRKAFEEFRDAMKLRLDRLSSKIETMSEKLIVFETTHRHKEQKDAKIR